MTALALDLPGDWVLLDAWFLVCVPIAWLVWSIRARRTRAALPTASASWLAEAPRTLRARLVRLPGIVHALAACALAVALARPVTREVVPIRSQGVDILLVIDQSSSMQADDVSERAGYRRIDAAREQALAFAEVRDNDRIGLVTFARFADLRSPLTLDHGSLAAFLRVVETVDRGSPEDSTAIGVALAKAVALLESGDAATRVVVLLTDGENNVADITVPEATRLAVDARCKVYTIGLGSGARGPFGMVIEPDFREIRAAAEATGGVFFQARNVDDLAAVYAEIDRLEKRELEDPRYRTTDRYGVPLAAAALLMLLGLLLDLLWIRGAP